MRLAKHLQCQKVESYDFAAKAIGEIGRLVGAPGGIDEKHCVWVRRAVLVAPKTGTN